MCMCILCVCFGRWEVLLYGLRSGRMRDAPFTSSVLLCVYVLGDRKCCCVCMIEAWDTHWEEIFPVTWEDFFPAHLGNISRRSGSVLQSVMQYQLEISTYSGCVVVGVFCCCFELIY